MSHSQNQINYKKLADQSSSAVNTNPDISTPSTQGFRSAPSSFDIAMPAQIQTNFIAPIQEYPHQFNPSMNPQSQQFQLQQVGMNLMQQQEAPQLTIHNTLGLQQQIAMTNESYNLQTQPNAHVPDAYIYGIQSNVLAQNVNGVSSHSQSFSSSIPLDKVSIKAHESQRTQSTPSLRPGYLPQFTSTVSEYSQIGAPHTSETQRVSSTLTIPKSNCTKSTNSAPLQSENDYPSGSSSSSPLMQPPSRGKRQRKHSSTSHEMTPETALRNRCRICNKQFKRPSSLQTHYYSHTGEKIFRCPWQGCGKMFSVKSNMTRHYRLHERDSRRAQELEFQNRNPELMRALGLSSSSSTVRQYFQPALHHPMQHQSQTPPQQLQQDVATFGTAQAQPRDMNQLDLLHRTHYQSYSPLSSQIPSLMQAQYMLNPLVVDTNGQTEQLRVSEVQQSPVQTINSRLQ
ncbi:hypothetical protein CORT_0C02650 [Candida orthopsilosis Co 90-125]|uniref:C2H2-type domain-containing protein n=1 Tax=Candida orthopsilosis (strain 90-125) TaxID=1136231 RepID=H8X2U3_CANO9|nr:hypothetical protein CORT_0C02650 [Candida orthopsilosis Co 90-125]CCG25640.1 hypothetical protein CORT_0C02650 [Candida orthopsilosis Co 90-125]